MNSQRILAGFLLLLAAATIHAAELQPFLARYAFAWHGMSVGESTLRLERDLGDRWKYTSSTAPRGLGRLYRSRNIVNETFMQETTTGMRPLSYRADDGSNSTERDSDLAFDWEKGRASGIANGQRVDMEVPEGTQDDLSVQIALMYELIAGRSPAGFRVFDEKGVREYRYHHEGSATLDTPLGAVQTEIYRSQRDGSPRATRFWCAPAYGFLPMRAEQRRKGEVEWTMDIRRVSR